MLIIQSAITEANIIYHLLYSNIPASIKSMQSAQKVCNAVKDLFSYHKHRPELHK